MRKDVSMKKNEAYIHRVRVRYADTDRMGVVYHGRYFEWFEAARTEMMRSMGMSYRELEETGIALPVVEAGCRYIRPVYYDEWVGVKTWLSETTRLKIHLQYRVLGEDGEMRVEGSTVHCFVNRGGKPIRAPKNLVEFFQRGIVHTKNH